MVERLGVGRFPFTGLGISGDGRITWCLMLEHEHELVGRFSALCHRVFPWQRSSLR